MKSQFEQMIQYRFRHLVDSGTKDPVRVITADFLDYMKEVMTDEQTEYVKEELNIDTSIRENALTLLEAIDVQGRDVRYKEALELLINSHM